MPHSPVNTGIGKTLMERLINRLKFDCISVRCGLMSSYIGILRKTALFFYKGENVRVTQNIRNEQDNKCDQGNNQKHFKRTAAGGKLI